MHDKTYRQMLPSGRREFLKSSGMAAAGLCLVGTSISLGREQTVKPADRETLALDGGLKAVAMAADILRPLDLRHVKVGGEIGRRIDVTVNNNLLVLEADKDFLEPFHAKKASGGYTGLGKLIDAAVHFAAHTNDEKVIALKKHLVEETLKAQEPDGYIGSMAAASRMWNLWDVHEMGYIILGLTSDYRHFGEKRSLEAARKAADYILQQWSTMPSDWPQRTNVATHVMVIGLEYSLLKLFGESGDRRYLDFCVRQRELPEWNPDIVMGRRALIEGHVYAYLDRCLAQLELYRLQPDENLLRPSRRAIRFMAAEDGMTIAGGVGQWEIWTDDQDGGKGLGETCATAYQLRCFDNLLRIDGNPLYGDLIERTIYNALFAAQSPDGRRIRYYTPLLGKRAYYQGDTYCCPGNFRRIMAELPGMVYYQSKAGLAINLYTPSEAIINLDGGESLNVRQETDYPNSGRVLIHLDPSKPVEFPLQLRIPRWCKKASLTINGRPWKESITSGKFFSIERLWTKGDCVTLDMPMTWRFVLGRKRQSGRAAVMRGPVVFCMNPKLNESYFNQDPDNLDIIVDPMSLKDLADINLIRRDGIACQIRASKDLEAIGVSGDSWLRLTEFPDPESQVVYFHLPDLGVAVPDELLSEDAFFQPKTERLNQKGK